MATRKSCSHSASNVALNETDGERSTTTVELADLGGKTPMTAKAYLAYEHFDMPLVKNSYNAILNRTEHLALLAFSAAISMLECL